MTITRAERRAMRESRAVAEYGREAEAALDALDLTDYAWHDCYGETSPPDDVIDDILVCGRGDLAKLVSAARAAVTDFRDVRLAADRVRSS